MRVVRVRVDEHQLVELHPAVSVVTGLDEPQRTRLRRTFAAVASGLAPDAGGLLEAHGVLLDLDQGALDVLDVAEVPSDAVLTAAHVPGAVTDEVAERLRVAERDVRVLAAAHRRAATAREAWEARSRALDEPDGDAVARRRRADELALALELHRATDAEPVRVAIDAVHDAERGAAGGASSEPVARVADALADVGLDVRMLDLPDAEVLRVAEEWSDEVRRRGSWAIGAAVELQGIEARLAPDDPPADERTDVAAAVARARDAAADARRVHADALVRADHARGAARLAVVPPTSAALEAHLLERLADQRQARLAGAVPVVFDDVFGAVPDDELPPLLDRLAQLAGGVQLVIIGDDPRPAGWARTADPHRVAVVAPGPGTRIGAPR